MPRSLVQSLRVFELRAPELRDDPGPVIRSAPSDPLTPWQELRQVTWPSDVWIRPGVRHYTADGTPPYLVHWLDTGQVTLLYPGPDAHVEHEPHEPIPGPGS